jgi:hypothetical protein
MLPNFTGKLTQTVLGDPTVPVMIESTLERDPTSAPTLVQQCASSRAEKDVVSSVAGVQAVRGMLVALIFPRTISNTGLTAFPVPLCGRHRNTITIRHIPI